ncbi:MAG: hypothetical protein ABSB35_20595 [Bryobacteraceae bacterium]|jgi:hypothetical protein
MAEPSNDLNFREAMGAFELKLSSDLAQTFNDIAKIAMQASAEFSDDTNNMKVLQKIQKAHSVVTLIMDDANRGLNKATTSALSFGVMSGLAASEDEPPSTR